MLGSRADQQPLDPRPDGSLVAPGWTRELAKSGTLGFRVMQSFSFCELQPADRHLLLRASRESSGRLDDLPVPSPGYW